MKDAKSLARALARRLLRAGMAVEPVRRPLRRLAHAGWLPRAVWQRLPVTGELSVALPDGGSFVYHAVPEDVIGRALYWRGVLDWEGSTVVPFLRLARTARRFLDIGANTGVYTLLACAANPALTAMAYEPVPRVYRCLLGNVARNGLGQRCTVRNLAVSSRREPVTLHVPLSALPLSASLARGGFRGMAGELIEIEATTVDDETAGGPAVDLMKIDVEGFEDQVLAGMARTLAADRPVIVCECNPDGPYQAVEALVASHGYVFFHLRAPAPRAVPHIVPDPTEHHRNYLLVPAEHAARVATVIRAGIRAGIRAATRAP